MRFLSNCRQRLFGWTAALLVAAAPLAAQAKPIELVVPIAPGGSTDALARVIAEELAKKWNEPVIVVSKPGAGVTVAARYVLEQPADGRTLFLGTAVMGVVPFQRVVPFDFNAFAPVVPLLSTPAARDSWSSESPGACSARVFSAVSMASRPARIATRSSIGMMAEAAIS